MIKSCSYIKPVHWTHNVLIWIVYKSKWGMVQQTVLDTTGTYCYEWKHLDTIIVAYMQINNAYAARTMTYAHTHTYIYLEPQSPSEIGQARVSVKVRHSSKSTALCKIPNFGIFLNTWLVATYPVICWWFPHSTRWVSALHCTQW